MRTNTKPQPAGTKTNPGPSQASVFGSRALRGFTLIELLIVIGIIAVLAAMIIPVTGAVNRIKIRTKARTQLEQIATAIDLYKAKLGHYPPDNRADPSFNQLYFELVGTTLSNFNGQVLYTALDGSAQAKASSLQSMFGAGGIINTARGGNGDEGRVATQFLKALKPDQVLTVTNAVLDPSLELVKILVSSIPSQPSYLRSINYVSSGPTNNPNSYDLWVDVLISGKTNRLSNWNKEAMIVP